MDDSDHSFIFESWHNGLKNANSWFKDIPEMVFKERFGNYYQNIFDRPGLEISIACLPDAEDVILGYIVYENKNIYWIYVKHSWRKMKIATSLFNKEINQCGRFLTTAGKILADKYGIIYNPFMEE